MLNSNNFVKGLNQDIHPKYQVEGTYRYALNAVLESKEGDLPSISNEIGNIYCATNWPDDKKIIGHQLLDNDEILVFLFDPSEIRPAHEIGVYNTTSCVYTSIVIDSLLNFSTDHPINPRFRIRNGCERIVYFTDNYNPYRVINISDTTD